MRSYWSIPPLLPHFEKGAEERDASEQKEVLLTASETQFRGFILARCYDLRRGYKNPCPTVNRALVVNISDRIQIDSPINFAHK